QAEDGIRDFHVTGVQTCALPTLAPRTWLYKGTETRTASVSFDKIQGKHDFKFGVEYRQYPQNQTSGSGTTGMSLTFNESFTRGRSEERRVGNEWRGRWSPQHWRS